MLLTKIATQILEVQRSLAHFNVASKEHNCDTRRGARVRHESARARVLTLALVERVHVKLLVAHARARTRMK